VLRKIIQKSLFITIAFLWVNQTSAYEEIEVTNGGVIIGEVKFSGTASKMEQVPVTKNQDYCGNHKPSENLLIGPNQGVKNAVVTIENITQGKKIDKASQPVLDNTQCMFAPHVQAAVVNTKLEIRNSDPILHNTHAFLNNATVFNLALPLQGQKIPKRLRKPGVVRVQCDAGHTWMGAYIVVTEHPYHGITDEKGTFKITDVPPGSYKLKAWHEELGTQVKEVAIKEKGEVKVVFDKLSK
jgi:hypothetical protein